MKEVLLITGWATPAKFWNPVAALLADKYELHVITPQEILDPGSRSWEKLSRKPKIGVGWSLGGMLLVQAIVEKKVICEELVLVSSCARMTSSDGILERRLKAMRRRFDLNPRKVLSDFWKEEVGEEYVEFGMTQPNLGAGLRYLSECDLNKELSTLKVRTTVIHGTKDQVIPFELGKQLATSIAGCRFIPIEDGMHAIPFSHPHLLAEEIGRIGASYPELEFTRSASTYDEWALPQRVIGDYLLDFASLWIDDCVRGLDIGCGTGFLIERIAKRHPKIRVDGLDVAPGMIEYCQMHFKDPERRDFYVGDATTILPNDGAYDLLISNAAFQWIQNLDESLSRFSQQLPANGKLVFSTLLGGSFSEFEASYRSVRGHDSGNLTWREANQYVDSLRQAGFHTLALSERSFTFSYRNAMDVLKAFKKTGAIKKRPPLSLHEVRALIDHYNRNFSNGQGVEVTYRVLSIVADRERQRK